MYPKARIDALTDGIFAVAMTILILDVRLPEDFHPVDDGAIAHALIGHIDHPIPTAISAKITKRNLVRRQFSVLGLKRVAGEIALDEIAVDTDIGAPLFEQIDPI